MVLGVRTPAHFREGQKGALFNKILCQSDGFSKCMSMVFVRQSIKFVNALCNPKDLESKLSISIVKALLVVSKLITFFRKTSGNLHKAPATLIPFLAHAERTH